MLRENKKEMLEIRNTMTQKRNALHRLICRVDAAEERFRELGGVSTEISKMKEKRNKTGKQGTQIL